MRILLEEDRFGGLLVLHACMENCLKTPLPTVIVWHGFTRSKEFDSNLAYMLARAGFRVLMPEADGHGERFNGDAAERLLNFWQIVRQSIDEMPRIRESLEQRRLIDDGRIGIAGLSMGGFITLGALARYDWLRSGVSWMGSAYFLDLARTLYPPTGRYDSHTYKNHELLMEPMNDYEPSRRLEQLASKPLMLWHGVRDEVVPFNETARLHADMTRYGLASRVKLVAEPNATHKLTHSGAEAGVAFMQSVL